MLVIDPNSDKARWVDLKNLTLNYRRDLILAVLFSIPVPFVAYILIYRGIYRSILNYKISKKVGDSEPDFMGGKQYNANTVAVGEVTKVRKLIVCYVKVRYRDENGAEREKWARSWFTHREAKLLRQKKTIDIVPYKNTYGILEQI